MVHAHANRQDYNFAKRQQMENWANQQKQWQQERAMRDSQAQMEGIARQKNTDDYKDFLMSGRSNDDMTASDMENVIFATGAQGYDNSELLKKSDWKPCKVLLFEALPLCTRWIADMRFPFSRRSCQIDSFDCCGCLRVCACFDWVGDGVSTRAGWLQD